MYKFWLISVILIVLSACSSSDKKKNLEVNEIIQRAIDSSGTNKFEKAIVQFQFREKTYRSIPTCKGLQLQREFKTDSTLIKDVLLQGKFTRTKDETFVSVQDSLAHLYAESINSVHYFVQLPFRLNDEAVQKNLVGTETDENKEYYKIKVSFQEEGGGEDFEDVYYYWIDSETFQIAYLAYSFKVNGGGVRFRRAINQQKVNGIQFFDYENYKPDFENAEVENSLADFLAGKYVLLSKIENTDILVNDVELHCD